MPPCERACARQEQPHLDDRLRRTAAAPLDRARAKVAALAGRLESLSPLNVLSRGYSLTRTPDGRVIQDAKTVSRGDILVTRLARGEVVGRVEEVRSLEETL